MQEIIHRLVERTGAFNVEIRPKRKGRTAGGGRGQPRGPRYTYLFIIRFGENVFRRGFAAKTTERNPRIQTHRE